MYEILNALPAGARVLDLGSGSGSFDARPYPLKIIRADLEPPQCAPENFVLCSAAALPFPEKSFDAVISNHSFEHFEDLGGSVKELTRILRPSGFVYIGVPDSTTFTDRVYRWLARGGGHVNAFSNVDMLPRLIVQATGLRLAGTRVLVTSLSFLNRRNIEGRAQKKLILFANGREGAIRGLVHALKLVDRWFGTRVSVYGWAYWFGDVLNIDITSVLNVCIRCGSAHAESSLEIRRRKILADTFRCPVCGAENWFAKAIRADP